MELLSSLQWRYATKKMNGQKVADEKVNAILEAINLAPTSAGLQPFTVLVIKGDELKNKIKPIAYNQGQVTDCSHLLVFAAWDNVTMAQIDEYMQRIVAVRGVPVESLGALKDLLTPMLQQTPEQNFNWNAKQTYIALGFAMAAAATEKIDSTPMEGFNPAALDELLELKAKGLRSVALLPLGYRDATQDWLAALPKVRKEKEKLFIHL